LARQRLRIGNYLPSVAESMRSALDVDWVARGSFGGAFGQLDRRLADMHGARWCRIRHDWRDTELEPGRYDWTGWADALGELRRNHIRPVASIALDGLPKFHKDLRAAGYAPPYGRYLYGLARQFHRTCRAWELGDEGNGNRRTMSPEIARHGSAGVRRADPLARIIVSGTGLVEGGLPGTLHGQDTFADFDVACVHPYRKNQSPERARPIKQCKALRRVLDSFGGWQDIWTAAWGRPHRPNVGEPAWWADQKRRARYIVRHHLLSVAGGAEKHGLSRYDGRFGIYDNTRPFLAAPANHTMIALLEGHRYVGPLGRLGNDGIYLVVYERNGRGTLVGWRTASKPPTATRSQPGSGEQASGVTLDLDALRLRSYDLMGNVQTLLNAMGRYELDLTESPSYWVGVGPKVVARAARAQLAEAARRLTRLATRANATDLTRWVSGLAELTRPSQLRARLEALPRRLTATAGSDEPADMAATCQALRVGELLAYLAEVSGPPKVNLLEPEMFDTDTQRLFATVRRRVELLRQGFDQMHRRDHTLAMLRWVIRHARRVLDDAETARRYGRYRRVALLTRSAEAYVATGAAVFNKHRPATRCVWITPYVEPTGQPGRASRDLHAVAGKPVTIRLRVNSYALRHHRGAIVAVLPEAWSVGKGSRAAWRVKTVKGRPARAARQIAIKPMVHQTYPLTLTPPARAKPGRFSLSLQLDVPTLTVAPKQVPIDLRP
jgi:hypothetical protein